MTAPHRAARDRLRAQGGFTMIITLGVMLVTSLLLTAAFTIAQSDIHSSHHDTTQKQAYYAALAGIQQYEYKLQANPNYWQSCPEPAAELPGEEKGESYAVKQLVSSSSPEKKCNTESPFATMIEQTGPLANTFRVESTGRVPEAGKYKLSAERTIVATFQVTGFLDYVYYTNYETLDPALYEAPEGCAGAYYKTWSAAGLACSVITFVSGDKVDGPMHTNDAARVTGGEFGRTKQVPNDAIEINGGTYPTKGCPNPGTFNTVTKCYDPAGPMLIPPQSDTSLALYVEAPNKFEGATHLVLNGSANTIAVTTYVPKGAEYVKKEETINWPKNGLIYVKAGEKGCGYSYEMNNSDTARSEKEELGCGNVFVEGTYSKSLTVAGETDLIIHNNVYPVSVEGKLGSFPPPGSTATLGLIASHYVRIYHPCESGTNGEGSLTDPWIYAALLSTAHSFVVDNNNCGALLGKLHVIGAIAQNYRGVVGTSGGGGGTGYLKQYEYDGRLATDEPPYFLAPLKAGWKIARQTAPNPG
jgi:type II secretory pathway pseudopilin PulG